MTAGHLVRIHHPTVQGQTVRFTWSVTPQSALYRSTTCSFVFPDSVDLTVVPEPIWFRVMLACLHPQWALLRPCRVVLPVTLAPGETEVWLRLCDAQVATLEAYADSDDTARTIELVEVGPRLAPLVAGRDTGVVTSCFSGGRDSLTQAALLQELGEHPILVNTVSARQGSNEHEHPRRRQVVDDIRKRRGLELVEVQTDIRGCFENGFAAERYGIAVTELTDTFVYFAAALVVAVARGAREVLLAAEAEVHETTRRGGLVVQHKHAMYSGVSQRTLSAILAPTGIVYHGLTASLRQFQVQRLLSQRYPDLRDLQHSCWSQTMDEPSCSACGECQNNALNLLADGVDPAAAGIDLARLLVARAGWMPRPHANGTAVPNGRSAFDAQTLRCLETITVPRMQTALDAQGAAAPDRAAALTAYEQTRAAALTVPREPEPGYRAGRLALQGEPRRTQLAAIFDEHFARVPDDDDRSHRDGLLLSDWIAAPLTHPEARPVRTIPEVRTAAATVRARPPSPVPPTDAELAPIRHLIPDPEPVLVAPADGRPILPVAATVLDGNERTYVDEAIDTNWISSAGSFVTRFEAAFAQQAGCRYGIACSSGTTALHLAVAAVGIGAGDEVIVPAFTMIASANAVDYVGGRPIFADTDAATWNVDVDRVRALIGPRTRAIMAVHTYGQPTDMTAIRALAEANGLRVIEDAAEAHGGEQDGRRVGSLGDVAAFSFYGNKILSTGEGGMVTTNDPEIAAVARELRDHAFSPERHFWHRFRAFNYRMSNLQGAVGLAQVERLHVLIDARRRHAALYAEALADVAGIEFPPDLPGRRSVHWVHALALGPEFGLSRDALRRHLAAGGIETRTFFVPLHLQPAYAREHVGRRHPVAERLGATGLYLPSSPTLTDADIERVAASVKAAARPRTPRRTLSKSG